MKDIKSILLVLMLLVCACGCKQIQEEENKQRDYVALVDPLIGSGGHGHVFVGASVPHGMVQLGPNNLSKGWDWCSGYHDSDSTIIGFAHTHLSGTGIADLGDIIFMPVHGVNGNVDMLYPMVYVSSFSKKAQYVTPGYYSVSLEKYGISAKLTATERVGYHSYVYPDSVEAQLVVDLDESVQSLMMRKGTLKAELVQLNDTAISGYRISDEWAMDHRVFFNTVFSAPIRDFKLYQKDKAVRGLLNFGCLDEPLVVKTGISYTSEDGAALNLAKESNNKDFDAVQAKAYAKWNQCLGTIDFHAEDDAEKIFYTALYHTMISPSIFADVDGKYRGADGKIHKAVPGFTPYTIFSLWDTYRAVQPLNTLIDGKVADYVNSLLDIYDCQGTLPVWHLAGNETSCMVGVHSIPIIVDACLKNIQGIDKERAFKAVRSIEQMNENGLDYVRNQGFIPADKVSWSVARGLEYAVDDYAVAMLAKDLNKEEDYRLFLKRSKYYTHYFDASLGFMRGKLSDGNWRMNFDPFHSVHLEDDYVEGNAWQYTWLVPHDPEGLIQLFGGKERFVSKLDSLFTVSSELNEGASIDISGLIGQYAHGNEPSHHILYLYAYVGENEKMARLLRQVYNNFYSTQPDGLIGNEDCGQMSAWYIFSALGFYPVNPVDGTFVFGTPLCNEATLKLVNGKELKIKVKNNSNENIYIQSVKLNGVEVDSSAISYQEIMNGGVLEYEMGKNN